MSTPSRLSARLLAGIGLGAVAFSLPVLAMLQTGGTNVAPPPPAAVAVRVRPAAEVVTEWERLLSPQVTPSLRQVTQFLTDHPGFPNEVELRQRGETAINAYTPAVDRLAFFAVSEPITAEARFRKAEALLATGKSDEAIEEARNAWRSGYMDGEVRAEFLSRFGGQMRAEDHASRADVQLWRGDLTDAAAMLSLLGPDDRTLTSSRITIQRGTARGGDQVSARAAISSIPANLLQHPGFIEDTYQFYRATGASGAARQLFAQARIAPGSAGDANRWMQAHLSATEAALADRQYQLAYDIASKHGGLSFTEPLINNSAKERDTFTSLEWDAGWTALHYLNRPGDAVRHFQNFSNAAKFAATRSRGLYWAGRSAEAAGRAEAQAFYNEAARYKLTFYGQLAHEKLDRPLDIRLDPVPQPTPATIAAWNSDPRVEAVTIYGRQGDTSKQKMFLSALADDLTTEQLPLYARLADQWGHERFAVLNTRGADATGPDAVVDLSWRRMALPASARHMWTMVHAITRQESQFELDAVSPAGARGLMQLMPATAKETARKVGQPYDYGALTRDRGYNITLGSAYLSNMIDYWGGSHVLAIASYNAGPGNVRKRIERYGDPRMPNTDVLEWIEAIPFYETRTYVRNVLENAVIYDQLEPGNRKGGPEEARLSWYLGKNDRG
ncbi:MAG: lytic transglycosylase domain-containing protein [Pacificimonas sp.]